MDIDTVLEPFLENHPRFRISTTSKNNASQLMVGHVEETVGIDHLIDCLLGNTAVRWRRNNSVIMSVLNHPEKHILVGKFSRLQLRRMLQADANVLIFLADWHVWVNDKFNGASWKIFKQLQHTWKRLSVHFLDIQKKEKDLAN